MEVVHVCVLLVSRRVSAISVEYAAEVNHRLITVRSRWLAFSSPTRRTVGPFRFVAELLARLVPIRPAGESPEGWKIVDRGSLWVRVGISGENG
jgi:hypothetical protein